MNTANVFYNLSAADSNIMLIKEPLIFKGSTSLNFILTGIVEEENEVLAIHIDWGDGTPKQIIQKDLIFDYREQSILNEIIYGKIRGRITTTYAHTFYNNSLSSHNISLTSQFLLSFNNGVYINFVQPISIFTNSYYDEIGDLNILNTQIIATSANNTFFNFEGHINNQTFVGIMSAH